MATRNVTIRADFRAETAARRRQHQPNEQARDALLVRRVTSIPGEDPNEARSPRNPARLAARKPPARFIRSRQPLRQDRHFGGGRRATLSGRRQEYPLRAGRSGSFATGRRRRLIARGRRRQFQSRSLERAFSGRASDAALGKAKASLGRAFMLAL